MEIIIDEMCNPPKTSHHAKRIVRFGGFSKLADKPELVDAKNFWDTLFAMNRPRVPLAGPLLMDMELTWPWNASDSKKVRDMGRVLHWKRPDTSNMLKTIEDSAGRMGLFTDDAQICRHVLSKWRGQNPGIRVTFRELNGCGAGKIRGLESPSES